MEIWTALIILTVASNPIANAAKDGPFDVNVAARATQSDPSFHMKGPDSPDYKVQRLTGVEADTIVNIPASTTMTFDGKDLCDTAVMALAQQNGVASASCVRTK
ncbi:MAG: hypothetical protein M3N50_01620 [Pseudomonadota bacterium]|nr:hypothetical protein [Pseudomonadota bacterium]